jgi:hypothetical protein
MVSIAQKPIGIRTQFNPAAGIFSEGAQGGLHDLHTCDIGEVFLSL